MTGHIQTKASGCIVTGGAGFIGCAISESLSRQFGRVHAIDNLNPRIHPTLCRPSRLAPQVELIRGDVTRPETWDAVLGDARPIVIIHLAGETDTGQSLTEASRHAHSNVIGTTQMLDAFLRHNCLPSRIVLASSRAVYGEGAWKDKTTKDTIYPGQRTLSQLRRAEWDFCGLAPTPFSAETTVPHPANIYGATKLAQENIVKAWTSAFGVDLVIFRLQNVYGPGQSLINSYTGVATLFARLAQSGMSIPVYEDGKMTRDFVYVDDVADAVCRAATQHCRSTGLPYDIGSGMPITVHQLACIIARNYSAPEPHITGDFRNGDIRHAYCDIARSIRDFGWTPRWTIENGTRMLCDWVDTQSVKS